MDLNDPLKGAGPGTASEARCLTCGEIVIITVSRATLLKYVIDHYETEHGMTGSMMLTEDRTGTGPGHFRTYPAPHRCDLCGAIAEPPWWVYVTPPDPPVYQVEDPEWLVCDPCHPLVERLDIPGIVARSLEQRQIQKFPVSPKDRKHITTSIRNFVAHFDSQQTRKEDAA